jgi:succinate dehydrogenase / fumarate reductase cytochrome b subunit
MKALLSYLTSSIGRKTAVALTGLALMLFVVGHMVGNLQVFLGADWINAYAHKLQAMGPLLWVIRLGLLAIVGTHILATLALVLENRKARPARYAVAAHRASTAASRTMAISGLSTRPTSGSSPSSSSAPASPARPPRRRSPSWATR